MLNNIRYILFLAIIASIGNVSGSQRCVLPLPRFAFFAPLIFHANGSLVYSENISELQPDITIPYKSSVVLSCVPNYFKTYPDKKILEATCEGQKDLLINNEIKHFLRHLACEVRSVEEVVKNIDGCPTEMQSVEYGFTNPIEHKSFVLGEACYSEEKGFTQFIHIKKPGSLPFADGYIKSIDSENYFREKHPDTKYKLDFLMASRLDTLNERLRQTLGTKNIPFIEPRNFIPMDFLESKQFMSVLKLGWNYVPTIGFDHMPNLDVLQSDISSLNGNDIDVYMGVHDVLKLTDESGNEHEIFMDEFEERFPLPKYIWLVVTDGNRGAAFSLLNNPDAKLIEGDELCISKCSEMSWLNGLLQDDLYRNVKRGHVSCCSVNEFMKKVKEMPQLDQVFDLMV